MKHQKRKKKKKPVRKEHLKMERKSAKGLTSASFFSFLTNALIRDVEEGLLLFLFDNSFLLDIHEQKVTNHCRNA